MSHTIEITNLVSEDLKLIFNNVYINSYGFKKNLQWETTNVIGRMDPIKTFKNTESKLDIKFTVIDPHTNIRPRTGDKRFYSYNNIIQTVHKVIYPSYIREEINTGEDYYMKSAPVLKVKIYKSNSNIIFDGYCTTNAIDINFRAEDVSSPSAKTFSNLDFSILFDIIHTRPGEIGSKFYDTDNKDITKKILGT